MPDRRTVSFRIATARSSAGVCARVPFRAVPIAVRAALTMMGSAMSSTPSVRRLRTGVRLGYNCNVYR
jgi:hypothetical protein